ncbi:HvfC/BufC N-terminal domain-containing protein [Aeromonas crassostreae]
MSDAMAHDPDLLGLQRAFAASQLGISDEVAARVRPGRFTPEALLQLYRNNFILSLTEVLAATYGATRAMVGEAFFDAAARGFILASPLEEGYVMGYGAGFADWLRGLPTTAHLPWLPELALFEWQLERTALLPPETRRWQGQALAVLALEAWGRVRLLLADNLTLLHCRADVVGLWRMALAQGDLPANPNAPCWLALQKQPDFSVVPLPLAEGHYRLLHACQLGATLASLDAEPELATLLPALVRRGLLVGFSQDEDDPVAAPSAAMPLAGTGPGDAGFADTQGESR